LLNYIKSYFKTSPQAQSSGFAQTMTGQAALYRGGDNPQNSLAY